MTFLHKLSIGAAVVCMTATTALAEGYEPPLLDFDRLAQQPGAELIRSVDQDRKADVAELRRGGVVIKQWVRDGHVVKMTQTDKSGLDDRFYCTREYLMSFREGVSRCDTDAARQRTKELDQQIETFNQFIADNSLLATSIENERQYVAAHDLRFEHALEHEHMTKAQIHDLCQSGPARAQLDRGPDWPMPNDYLTKMMSVARPPLLKSCMTSGDYDRE